MSKSDGIQEKRGLFRSGFVSLTGRPNVGKSTFLNAVLGQKVSIVTDKPQTTRNRIIGIKTLADAQVIFVDTPGIHRPRHGLGAYMVREARQALKDVDEVLYMVEPRAPGEDDARLIKTLGNLDKPVLLLINKVDKVRKADLLPVMKEYGGLFVFEEIIPVSALRGEGVDIVLDTVRALLPEGPKYYPDDMVTDSLERFMVAEIVREKLMLATHEEVPHSTAVEVSAWKERARSIHVSADIYVEKEGQKGIIIGKKGQRLKEAGTLARGEIQDLLGAKVYLELFVKVRKDWRTRKSVLADMGYR